MTTYTSSRPAPETFSPSSIRRTLVLVASAILAVLFGMGLAMSSGNLGLVLTLVGLAVAVPFIWHRPQFGLYMLAGAAASIETYYLHFPDSLTDLVPFYHSLNSLGSPLPMPLTPGEIIGLFTVGVVIVKRLSNRQKAIETGPLFPPVALLTAFAAVGLVHGLATGGSVSAANYEVRPEFYLAVSLVLTYTLVQKPGQVRLLLWIMLCAIALKGVLGMWRYLVTLHGNLNLTALQQLSVTLNANSIFSHEEAFFFDFFMLFPISMFLFRTGKVQRMFAVAFLIPIVISFLAMNRRAALIALVLGVIVIAFAALLWEPSRRRMLITVGVVFLVVFPVYVVAFGSSNSTFALPARAIVSLYHPDPRDQSSNQYRVAETENISRTIVQSPIIGVGYGRPFSIYYPMANISVLYSFWNIAPHDSLLWVWLKLGIVGMAVFWFFIGRSLIATGSGAHNTPDPYLRAIGALTLAMIIAWIVEGATDIGFIDIRMATMMGVLLGVAARIPLLAPDKEPSAAPTSPQA